MGRSRTCLRCNRARLPASSSCAARVESLAAVSESVEERADRALLPASFAREPSLCVSESVVQTRERAPTAVGGAKFVLLLDLLLELVLAFPRRPSSNTARALQQELESGPEPARLNRTGSRRSSARCKAGESKRERSSPLDPSPRAGEEICVHPRARLFQPRRQLERTSGCARREARAGRKGGNWCDRRRGREAGPEHSPRSAALDNHSSTAYTAATRAYTLSTHTRRAPTHIHAVLSTRPTSRRSPHLPRRLSTSSTFKQAHHGRRQ